MSANIQPIGAVRMEGLYAIPLEWGIELASQVYLKGNPLVYSSGSLEIAGTNPTAIVGIAASKATGVTGAPVPYVPALPDSIIFEISVDGTLVASDAPGTGYPSQFTIGALYGITLDPVSGQWYLDSSKSGGNQVARLVDYDADQASVINGRVHIRWLRSTTIYV